MWRANAPAFLPHFRLFLRSVASRKRRGSGCGASQKFEDRRRREACSALADVAVLLARARRAGDVDVHPRNGADELLQEKARGQRAAPALAGVPEVGDLGFELLG